MTTAKTTLTEYRAEKAGQSLSVDQKIVRLTGGSETLRTRDWTDGEILAIPDDLLGLAFEHSDVLRGEFGSLAALMAYRRAVGQGKARIAGARKSRS